jgi:predicted membrane protein
LALMLAGTAYPLVFARADGRADHGLAMLLFWAMSAGFVRGVGFIPRHRAWRLLFSGWACLAALALAALSVGLRAG